MGTDTDRLARIEVKLDNVIDNTDKMLLDMRGIPGKDGGVKERVRLLWDDRHRRQWWGRATVTLACGALLTSLRVWWRG